jgi:hypothetical protein
MVKEHGAFFILSRPRRAVVFVAPDLCTLDWLSSGQNAFRISSLSACGVRYPQGCQQNRWITAGPVAMTKLVREDAGLACAGDAVVTRRRAFHGGIWVRLEARNARVSYA